MASARCGVCNSSDTSALLGARVSCQRCGARTDAATGDIAFIPGNSPAELWLTEIEYSGADPDELKEWAKALKAADPKANGKTYDRCPECRSPYLSHGGGSAVSCVSCGTKFSADDGAVIRSGSA